MIASKQVRKKMVIKEKLDEVMESLLESRKKVFNEVEINITKAQEKTKKHL